MNTKRDDEPIPYRPGMTLMPGQSTEIFVPITDQAAGHFPGGQFIEVPPPEKAPVHDIAETLGLCDGLRAERHQRQYRCANCSNMQPVGSWIVWVPDGVLESDPAWSVIEAARLSAYNGCGSGWCLRCARKLSKKSSAPSPDATTPSERYSIIGFFRWLFK